MFCLCLAVNADAAIFIEQGKVVHKVVPGSKLTGEVTVHNTGNEPEKVKIYWEDFEYSEPYNGSKNFMPAGSSPVTFVSWIRFTPMQLDLPPFGKADISYIIDTPEDFIGGRYGVMFFEPVDPQIDPKTGMNIVSRVGSLFFLESSDKSKSAALSNVELTDTGFMADFQNRGDVVQIPDGTYYVMDSDGVAVDRGDVPKVYVPPGKTAKYKFDFNNDFAAGRYTIILTVDLQEQDVIVKEIDFQKDPDSRVTVLGSRD